LHRQLFDAFIEVRAQFGFHVVFRPARADAEQITPVAWDFSPEGRPRARSGRACITPVTAATYSDQAVVSDFSARRPAVVMT
jgi:hypothetical protein